MASAVVAGTRTGLPASAVATAASCSSVVVSSHATWTVSGPATWTLKPAAAALAAAAAAWPGVIRVTVSK